MMFLRKDQPFLGVKSSPTNNLMILMFPNTER